MLRRSWAFLIVAALAVTACEGPEGPQGPAGPAGPAGAAGPAGPAGEPGQDANESCTNCHTGDVEMFAKQQQLIVAAHGPGQYVRDSGECAVCHSHQGFLERLETGEWAYHAPSVDDVVPMNCRTCHQIHTTYTRSDYTRRSDVPVKFRVATAVTGADVIVDFADYGQTDPDAKPNDSNLCAACHQSRLRDPMPVPGGADVNVTSTHYGPHHGPQGDMNAGVGFFFAGTAGGPFAHQMDARSRGCPTCHMAEGSLVLGGHTFEMSDRSAADPADWDYNTAGCEICHDMTGVVGFDKFDIQTDVQALVDQLGGMLVTAGVVELVDGEYHVLTGTHSADEVAAWWNLSGVLEDGSLGVHNPPYIKAILNGAIAALTP